MRRPVRSSTRVLAVALLAALLLPAVARADDPQPQEAESGWARSRERVVSGLAVGFDVVLLRPLAAVHLLIGGALFVPAAGLSYFAEPDSLQHAREVFIDLPAENLFQRRLGDL